MEKLKASNILCVILLSLSYPYGTEAIFGITLGDLKAMFDWSYEVYSKMNEAYDSYGTFTADASLESIISEVSKLALQVEQIGARIEQKVDSVMRSLLQRLPAMRQRDDAIRELSMNLDIIDRFYRDFEVYKDEGGAVNDLTLKRWAKSITSHDGGDLPDVLWKIYRLMVPGHDLQDGLLLLISRVTEQSILEICDTGLSPQQRLHQLYQTVLERQMKGYLMTVFAYTLLGVYEKGNFTTEMKAAESQFELTARRFLTVVIQAMKHAPRDIRRCDPKEHKRNRTFVELERLMQSYIVNEVDVSAKGNCDGGCSSMPTQQHRCYDGGNFCANRWCTGDLIWCGYGGGRMSACQLPKSEVRRFEWFSDPDGDDGIRTKCEDGKMYYFGGWQRGFLLCDYCVCTCMQDRVRHDDETTRTIDFRDQISDIEQNMVVIGLRFVTAQKMIHVRILQAPLLPEGQINIPKLKWKKLDNWKYELGTSEKLHWDTFSIIWINKDGVNITSQMRYGRDYGGIRREQRKLELDNILLPEDYLVTGVRFKHTKVQNKPWDYLPIRLEVHGTPFDYESGLLVPTEEKPSMWFNSDNMPNRPDKYYSRTRRELSLNNAGNPINFPEHAPDSEPNTYLMFDRSDRRRDAGQSTIPFFDALQIGGKVAFPLSGVGIFHRGYAGSGGFLAFRIYGIDLTNYMIVPEEDDNSEMESQAKEDKKGTDYDTEYY